MKYNKETKSWYMPSKDFGEISLFGPALFKKFKELHKDRVLEINHTTREKTNVEDMHRMTVTIAKNLQDLGIQKGDIVCILSNLNSFITPLCYACFTIGAIVNPVPYDLVPGELLPKILCP